MKLASAFKQRCEGIAVDCRHRLNLRAFDPLPADQLLAELEGRAFPPDKLPYKNISPETVTRLLASNEWSGAVIQLQPLVIMYHPSQSANRYQSSLMHELAHVLLEHPMSSFDPVTGLPVRNPRYEDEATYLGGCLQIPRRGLAWTVERIFSCAQIAAHFGASEQMVKFRSNMTGMMIKSE